MKKVVHRNKSQSLTRRPFRFESIIRRISKSGFYKLWSYIYCLFI